MSPGQVDGGRRWQGKRGPGAWTHVSDAATSPYLKRTNSSPALPADDYQPGMFLPSPPPGLIHEPLDVQRANPNALGSYCFDSVPLDGGPSAVGASTRMQDTTLYLQHPSVLSNARSGSRYGAPACHRHRTIVESPDLAARGHQRLFDQPGIFIDATPMYRVLLSGHAAVARIRTTSSFQTARRVDGWFCPPPRASSRGINRYGSSGFRTIKAPNSRFCQLKPPLAWITRSFLASAVLACPAGKLL